MGEQPRSELSRRQALRRFAAAGALAWAIPAVQTINMDRAFAQTQVSQPLVCSWFRISGSNVGAAGACIDVSSDSCLSASGGNDCAPVVAPPSTPPGASWTVLTVPVYTVQEVALMDAAGRCWKSSAMHANPAMGEPVANDGSTGGWAGWTATAGALVVVPSSDAFGAPVDIAHVDVVACADPNALAALRQLTPTPTPSATATPSASPSASGSPSPSASPSQSPTTTPTPTASPPTSNVPTEQPSVDPGLPTTPSPS